MAVYGIIGSACIGFFLSLYAVIIEQKIKKNPEYKPACNISDRISCTKPLQSTFSRPFGISNGTLGLVFYPTIILLASSGAFLFVYYAAIAACLMSGVLASILYGKIKTFCLICSAIYVTNIILLISSYNAL